MLGKFTGALMISCEVLPSDMPNELHPAVPTIMGVLLSMARITGINASAYVLMLLQETPLGSLAISYNKLLLVLCALAIAVKNVFAFDKLTLGSPGVKICQSTIA